MVESDLGRFGPWAVRTLTLANSDLIKTGSELAKVLMKTRSELTMIWIELRSELTKVHTFSERKLLLILTIIQTDNAICLFSSFGSPYKMDVCLHCEKTIFRNSTDIEYSYLISMIKISWKF